MCRKEGKEFIGRRGFRVLKHHSIYYGSVFREGDVTSHSWNCNYKCPNLKREDIDNGKKEFKNPQRPDSIPFVFE